MEEKIETRARDGKSETDRQVAVTPGKRKTHRELRGEENRNGKSVSFTGRDNLRQTRIKSLFFMQNKHCCTGAKDLIEPNRNNKALWNNSEN